MRDYVCAISAGMLESTPALDLNHYEEMGSEAHIVAAILPRERTLAFIQTTKKLHIEELETVTQLAIDGAQTVHKLMKDTVLTHTKQRTLDLGIPKK